MKKYVVASVLLIFSLSFFAQNEVGTFTLTPRVGVSIANLSNMEMGFDGSGVIVNPRYKTGLAGGVEAEYQFHRLFSASVGAFYGMQGCRYPDQETDGIVERTGLRNYKMDAQYIHTPLLVHACIAKGLAVKAGIDMSFLLAAKVKGESTVITVGEDGSKRYNETEVINQNWKNTFRSVNVSIPVGVSYEYMNVVLDARYHIPLTNVFKESILNEKHQYWTFTLGYKFTIL